MSGEKVTPENVPPGLEDALAASTKIPVKKRACENLRWQLKECLMESDCHKKEGKNLKDCINLATSGVPNECYELRWAFMACKRSLVDMRARFRGRPGDHR